MVGYQIWLVVQKRRKVKDGRDSGIKSASVVANPVYDARVGDSAPGRADGSDPGLVANLRDNVVFESSVLPGYFEVDFMADAADTGAEAPSTKDEDGILGFGEEDCN